MNDLRGSIWRKCDFHVHTPCSVLHQEFGSNFDNYVKNLFQQAIENNIKVIGVTDYFTIEGYKKIKTDYLEKNNKLAELFTPDEIQKIQQILVLPNIEFRLNKIVNITRHLKDDDKKETPSRINFHVLFSDAVPLQYIEENFLHDIDFVHEAEPAQRDRTKKLKIENLKELGRKLKDEQPGLKGTPLQIGMSQAVVDDKQIMELLTNNNNFNEKYLIVVPSDEDLSKIQWVSQDGLTRKVLLQKAHAFFSSNPKTIDFGLGLKHPSIESFINEFQTLKPCIWGSDAHSFDNMFKPDEQRYCWIKADPTFEGIRQILHEPNDRVFIGNLPELCDRISNARKNYMDSLTIDSKNGYDGKKGVWFNNIKLEIGLELTAIIGNKGKGKSAIADILGLLGHSHVDQKDFSFLNKNKFHQKGYGENFTATLKWFDNTECTRTLDSQVDSTNVERVKYIPQSYLEKLCNDEGERFTEEINNVVFARLDDSDKLGKGSFSELIKYKTENIHQEIEQFKVKLNTLNQDIELLKTKGETAFKDGIKNQLASKRLELENLQKEIENLNVVPNPEETANYSIEQREKIQKVTLLRGQIESVADEISKKEKELSEEKIKCSDTEKLLLEIQNLKDTIENWKTNQSESYEKYDLKLDEILNLSVNTESIQAVIQQSKNHITELDKVLSTQSDTTDEGEESSLRITHEKLLIDKNAIEKDLEKPFKDYQTYKDKQKLWENKKNQIIGNISMGGSIENLNYELQYINETLESDINESINKRKEIISAIFNLKKQVQEVYNKAKIAISETLKDYSEEQNITIETSFKIDESIYRRIFDYVFRYGFFYKDSSDDALRKIIQKYDFDNIDNINTFLNELFNCDLKFKEDRALDFYNYLCSLDYLHPEYDLRLNGKSLMKLSPGEKGGLLLVFYLVLDKDNKPLIIDQPEDNLDNQSVAEILVPYIKIAKKKRQIIMVTHNPNLAIVADAEQIIYMDIEKNNNFKVSCESGGIENLAINNHIVNILEGKMKAFNNRRMKYRT